VRKKLTAKTIETLAHHGPRRLEVYDVTLPGFGLRISPNDHKSWFCVVRDYGRQRRVTLGPYPRVSLADARDAARTVMSDAKAGVLAPPCPTLGETVPQFIELYARPKNRNWRESERITWDQGKEMHAHKRFTFATNVQVYFCDPRSPWQRGSNENTNGLLRQYFPRGTNFSRLSQSYLNSIAFRLNQRPRKTLGFKTPADKLREVLR
jgi:hypothetical protein